MERKWGLVNVMILLLALSFGARSEDEFKCVYTIYVRTGSVLKAGTDSAISLQLYDVKGDGVEITDLAGWGGLMGAGYDYFERGNLDIFSGRGPCLSGPVCAVNVISDGSGAHHGWYCNYVEVTTTGPHVQCAQQTFEVEQWLALDTSPYQLSAARNYCPYDLSHHAHRPLKTIPYPSPELHPDHPSS